MKNTDFSIIGLIISSDLISKFILLILICASIVSWALIIERIVVYVRIHRRITQFDKNFWITHSLDSLYQQSKLFDSNPLSLIFVQSMEEWKKVSHSTSQYVLLAVKERILNSMHYIKNLEIAKLDKYLYILALIGSKAPFVGLLGTVWGIMNSFQAIAVSKNTSLNVVAPGVAEALVVTAVGLWVAIPSLIFYNILSARLSQLDSEIDYFIGRVYNLFSELLDEKIEGNKTR